MVISQEGNVGENAVRSFEDLECLPESKILHCKTGGSEPACKREDAFG